MNVVIPSYEMHIGQNINFLNSFRKYCLDKKNVKINLICSKSNKQFFLDLKNEFRDINLNVFTLNYLIKKVDNIDFDDSLGNFNTKFPYQSLKKLLSYCVVDSDYMVLDSENVCLKYFCFEDTFNELKNKKIKYSEKYEQQIQQEVVSNCNHLLQYENHKWFFLNPYWIYEKEKVQNLVDELREINKHDKVTLILKDKIFFEYQLYCNFLTKHSLKDTIEVKEILGNKKKLLNNLEKSEHTYEYICSTLTSETLDDYISLLNEMDEKITRLHWMPESFSDKIIKNTKVCIGTFI